MEQDAQKTRHGWGVRHAAALAASLAVGVFMTWLVFRNTDWGQVGEAALRAHPGWLILSAALSVLACVMRGVRLRMFVARRPPDGLRHYFSAVQIGDFVHMAAPVRAGVFVRAFLMERFFGMRYSRALAITMVDRLMESSGVAVVVLIAAFVLPMQPEIYIPAGYFGLEEPITLSRNVMRVVSLGLAGGTTSVALFLAVYHWRGDQLSGLVARITRPFLPRFTVRLEDFLKSFSNSINQFQSWRHFVRVASVNAVFWAISLVSFGCLFSAFGLNWPWYAPLLLLSFIVIALLLPNAPGFVGQYHAGVVVSLLTFAPDTPDHTAKAIAITIHLMHMGTLAGLGVACLAWEHVGFATLHKAAAERHEAAKA